MKWHDNDDHHPVWVERGGVACDTCGHVAESFACTSCGKIADESVIGHGSLDRPETHYPTRPETP